jgi:hypothetical protein
MNLHPRALVVSDYVDRDQKHQNRDVFFLSQIHPRKAESDFVNLKRDVLAVQFRCHSLSLLQRDETRVWDENVSVRVENYGRQRDLVTGDWMQRTVSLARAQRTELPGERRHQMRSTMQWREYSMTPYPFHP